MKAYAFYFFPFFILGSILFLFLYCNSPLIPVSLKESEKVKKIHVLIPHYKNSHLLDFSLSLLQALAVNTESNGERYTILTQEETLEEREEIKKNFSTRARVVHFPQPGKIGGNALPAILKASAALTTEEEIVLLSDVDSFILTSGWNAVLRELFKNNDTVLAAINPREGNFDGFAEWNWLAYRTNFYRESLITSQNLLTGHDWGHWFTYKAQEQKKTQFLWNLRQNPFPGRSPILVGDHNHPTWALHLFYQTRTKNEVNLAQAEKNNVFTRVEFEQIKVWICSLTKVQIMQCT